jgi:sn-glycerol 3-phosphate transport system substrate-binding protein
MDHLRHLRGCQGGDHSSILPHDFEESPLRIGNSIAIRDAIEEQMEHIFNGNKTPHQGLDDAVAKGNEILKEFAALT